MYEFHQTSENDITIIVSVQSFEIPYGIIEMKNGGELENIEEKSEYNFLINAVMYILNKKVVEEIPDN